LQHFVILSSYTHFMGGHYTICLVQRACILSHFPMPPHHAELASWHGEAILILYHLP
jgi:hypothetical protein